MEFTRLVPCLITSLPLPNFAEGVIFLGAKGENMKKLLTILLSVIMAMGAVGFLGCNAPNHTEPTKLSFYAPDGAPALAIAKFINDNESFGIDATIDYNVVASSDIGGVMQTGKGDFIVMPVNAASKLYKANQNDPYVMTAVVTHGNLYLMSSDGTSNLESLKGKVVGVIGQGLVPDLTFRAILSDNGLIDDVVFGDVATPDKITLRYFASAPDLIPMLKTGKLTDGLLPEPAATNLIKVASDKTWERVDVQELYDNQSKSYPQAVLMVKKSVYNKYKTNIDGMEQTFISNVSWVKQNTALAVTAVNGKLKDGLTPSLNSANITAQVVDNCKIYYQPSSQAKDVVKDYIEKIISISSASAKTVGDDFFA